jgi:ectoine hydroxylase-related dioxygenase (phytanoyl-CoA dioxygenase family)
MGTDVLGTGLPWVEAIADSFASYSFRAFHQAQLPQLVAQRGALVAEDLCGVAPVALRIEDGTTFTWVPTDQGMQARAGDLDASTVVELSEATFSEFLHELLTASGSVRTGRACVVRGQLTEWQRWEPAIRSLLSGREIYGPGAWSTLVDRGGEPLDLHHAFHPDDDRDEMRHFLATAGYLHIRGVFTADEIAEYSAAVEHVRALTAPGDPFSWWSVNAGGEEVVTRINYLGRHSPFLDQLCFEPRLLAYARLAGPQMRVCDDRLDGPMVFIKNSNVVIGNSDLNWHVDDGIGGHPVMCPLIQAGVQLDHASPANGQLLVLAGSHRYTKHWYDWGGEEGLPVVAFETEPGDLTVHYGDTMHTTPAPTADGAGRRALYFKFAEPHTFEWVPSGCHYNDVLFRPDDDGRLANRATTWRGAQRA